MLKGHHFSLAGANEGGGGGGGGILSAKFKQHHLRLAVANERSGDGGGSVHRKHRVAALGVSNGGWTRGKKDEYEDNGGRKHSRMGHISAVLLLLLVGASRLRWRSVELKQRPKERRRQKGWRDGGKQRRQSRGSGGSALWGGEGKEQ
jgi:hypothetical protein